MSEAWFTVDDPNFEALDAALRTALGAGYNGLSCGAVDADGHNLRVHFVDAASEQQLTDTQAVISAHDPVFLSADTARIDANGIDEATITVRASSPVTLLVEGVEVAVELTDGAGEVGITSTDPQTILVRVKDGANRSTQELEVRAI